MSTRGTEKSVAQGLARPVAVSVAMGTVFCAVVLLLLSVVLSARTIPQMLVDPMAIFALCAGAFVSGLICSKITRENGLLHGALCGAVMTVVVLLVSLALKDNGFGIPALFKIVFIMLSAMLGGVLGVNTKRRRK